MLMLLTPCLALVIVAPTSLFRPGYMRDRGVRNQPVRLQIETTTVRNTQGPSVIVPGVTKLTDDGYEYSAGATARYGGSEAWLTNLLTTGQSRVLERISGHLAATITVAAAWGTAFEASRLGVMPDPVNAAVQASALPEMPHGIVGSFIGLLLAFRTGQAYDRFWEARTLWDGVFSHVRSTVRLASACNSAQTPLIVGLSAALPYAFKQHLRGERNVDELMEAARLASGESRSAPLVQQLTAAAQQPNVALAVLDCLTRAILPMRTEQSELVWWQLDEGIKELIVILGKMERIRGTPVPLSYSRHTSRFFSVYTFTLPLALCSKINPWLLPPVVGVVSWVIFATEEIGHIIENPFGEGLSDDPDLPGENQLEVLPLGRYCAEMASDAATLFSGCAFFAEEMPLDESDNVASFDDVA